jgi:hypothetical protein
MVHLMDALEFGYGSNKKISSTFFIIYVSNDQFASIITAHD